MTLRELIADHPDALDRQLVMAKDGEGDDYSPLSCAEPRTYEPTTPWSGYLLDDDRGGSDGAVPALVLWPTN